MEYFHKLDVFLRQVISLREFPTPLRFVSQLRHYWNFGKQFFGGQNISLLVAATIPQVIKMTKDTAIRFSAVPSTQSSAALTENHFEAKDGLCEK